MVSFERQGGPFMQSVRSDRPLLSREDKMKYEAYRLQTFENWKYYDNARPIKLAKHGFYSVDEDSDTVTCFSCGIQKSQWRFRSDPEREHRNLNPHCLHVRGQDENNIPILVPDEDISLAILRQLHSIYCSDTSRTSMIDMTSTINSGDQRPVHDERKRPIQLSYVSDLSDSPRKSQPSRNDKDSRFLSEGERLKTFDRWTHETPTPEQLACEGFIYTGVSDRVQCVFCNGILRNWEVDDDPSEEHRKHFPSCPFVTNKNVGNIPILRTLPVDLGVTLTPQPSKNVEDGGQSSFIRDDRIEILTVNNDSGLYETGIVTEPPRHPQFSTEASRIASFTKWPPGLSQTPQLLAKAGFFYAGFDDSVKCFYCDGGLRTWEANDDPWIEHARWFSRCPYVLQVKGEAFVEQSKNRASATGNSQTEEREITARMDLPVVQKVLSMDIPRDLVKLVIQDRLNRTGDDFVSVEDLLNAIYHLGDKTTVSPTSCTATANKPTGINRNLPDSKKVDTGSQGAASRETAVLYDSTSSIGDTDSNADHESLLLENQRLKDQRTCKICMDEEANIVLLPCGHLVSCGTCAPALRKCPICRANIKGTVRTYLS